MTYAHENQSQSQTDTKKSSSNPHLFNFIIQSQKLPILLVSSLGILTSSFLSTDSCLPPHLNIQNII